MLLINNFHFRWRTFAAAAVRFRFLREDLHVVVLWTLATLRFPSRGIQYCKSNRNQYQKHPPPFLRQCISTHLLLIHTAQIRLGNGSLLGRLLLFVALLAVAATLRLRRDSGRDVVVLPMPMMFVARHLLVNVQRFRGAGRRVSRVLAYRRRSGLGGFRLACFLLVAALIIAVTVAVIVCCDPFG